MVVKIFSWCASNIFLFTDGVEDLPGEQQHVEAEADPADDQRVDCYHQEHSHQDLEPEPDILIDCLDLDTRKYRYLLKIDVDCSHETDTQTGV